MTEEEKKAIEKIEQLIKYLKKWNENFTIVPEDVKYFETILNAIKTYMRMTNEGIEDCLEYVEELEAKDTEINKLNNVIDRLLRDIYKCIQNDDNATILSIKDYGDYNTFEQIKDKYKEYFMKEDSIGK